MGKLWIAFAAGLCALSLSASADQMTWVLKGGRFEYAKSPGEFRLLRKLYPEYLEQYDPSEIDSASITFHEWALTGSHCAASDARLRTETTSVSVCIRDSQSGARECETTAQADPASPGGDFCL